MRVFIDTNVLVSAFSSTRFCSDLIPQILEFHELTVSRTVMEELNRVLRTKIAIPEEVLIQANHFLNDRATIIESAPTLEISLKDKDDIKILSEAIQAKADFFITGDKEVLSLGRIGPMQILSPRDFLGLP